MLVLVNESVGGKGFLKKFILTAPNNKILTFGGDDIIAENLIGHAAIARKGITQALSELVSDDWIALNDALDLVDDLMHTNAEKLFKYKQSLLKVNNNHKIFC